MKNLFFITCFFVSTALAACSCFATYQPLAEIICTYQGVNYPVFEMRLNRTTPQGAFFTVEQTVTGEINRSEIFVYSGDGSNCGFPVHTFPVNSRYLYFTGPEIDSTGIGNTFECGPSKNLYELNANSTQIRFMTPGEEPDSWPGPLEWQNYQQLLEEAGCALATSVLPLENPLNTVDLTANPGDGIIQLYTPTDSFPEIEKIQVFDISGRLVFSSSFALATPTQPYNLTRLPIGVYTVVVSNQKWRRGMKYVKAR